VDRQEWIDRYLNHAIRRGWIEQREKQKYQPDENTERLQEIFANDPESAAEYVALWFEQEAN
jgi:hypothetical protein